MDSQRQLRAVSFNIGLRGMRRAAQHYGSAVGLVQALDSPDVVGLQETKLSGKADVAEEWATAVPGYFSLWACNRRKSAYSGVALYLREGLRVVWCASTFSSASRLAGAECAASFRRLCEAVPDPDWAAWAAGPRGDGFSAVKAAAESAGLAQGTELLPDADSRAVAAAEAEQVSVVAAAAPQAGAASSATSPRAPAGQGPAAAAAPASFGDAASAEPVGAAPAASGVTPEQLDDEGRLIVADLGFAVVVNCYFPCAASDARVSYKAAFHDAVSGLCRWLAAAGREVVLMGDVNASHGVADHCAPDEWLRHTMGRSAAAKALAAAAAVAAGSAAQAGVPGVAPGGRDAFAAYSGVSGWASATARPVPLPEESKAAFEAGIFRQWISGLTGAPEARRPPSLVEAGLERRMAAWASTAAAAGEAKPGTRCSGGAASLEPPRVTSDASCPAKTREAGDGRLRGGGGGRGGDSASAEAGGDSEPLFVDTFRACHPWLQGAFSCWSEMTSARKTNFGSRIDYVLATRGLARASLAGAAVMQSVTGSDHCPVSAVFALGAASCERGAAAAAAAGKLSGPNSPSASAHVPVSAECDPDGCDPLRWPQFAARQRRLSAFFGSARAAQAAAAKAAAAAGPAGAAKAGGSQKQPPSPVSPPAPISADGAPLPRVADRRAPKRQSSIQALLGVPAPKRTRAGSRPSAAIASGLFRPSEERAGAPHGPAARVGSSAGTAKAWQRLLKGPLKPPLCNCRPRAPAVERRVLKAGENLNRVFYVCSKPAGRKEAGGRCNFFMWGSAWQAKQTAVQR